MHQILIILTILTETWNRWKSAFSYQIFLVILVQAFFKPLWQPLPHQLPAIQTSRWNFDTSQLAAQIFWGRLHLTSVIFPTQPGKGHACPAAGVHFKAPQQQTKSVFANGDPAAWHAKWALTLSQRIQSLIQRSTVSCNSNMFNSIWNRWFEQFRNLKWVMLLFFFCKHHQARASFAFFSGIDASKIVTNAAVKTPWCIELMRKNLSNEKDCMDYTDLVPQDPKNVLHIFLGPSPMIPMSQDGSIPMNATNAKSIKRKHVPSGHIQTKRFSRFSCSSKSMASSPWSRHCFSRFCCFSSFWYFCVSLVGTIPEASEVPWFLSSPVFMIFMCSPRRFLGVGSPNIKVICESDVQELCPLEGVEAQTWAGERGPRILWGGVKRSSGLLSGLAGCFFFGVTTCTSFKDSGVGGTDCGESTPTLITLRRRKSSATLSSQNLLQQKTDK